MATKSTARDRHKENESLRAKTVKDKYDKIKIMCDDLWGSGLESIVVSVDTQTSTVWNCGSVNGILFLKERSEIKEKFLKFCVDMTSRSSNDCYTNSDPDDDGVRTCHPGEELVTKLRASESEVDDAESASVVPEINQSLSSETSRNNVVHETSKTNVVHERESQGNRVQTRSTNRRGRNKTENKTSNQNEHHSKRGIKDEKGKNIKMEIQEKAKNADKIPIKNTKERNAKSSGHKTTCSQARKRAKLEPKSNEGMHSKENSVKASDVEADVKMQIFDTSQEENAEEKQCTKIKDTNKIDFKNQNIGTESVDVNVKATIEEIFENLVEVVSASDFVVISQDGVDKVYPIKEVYEEKNDDSRQSYSCKLCCKYFKTQALVLSHVSTVHSSGTPFRCRLCGELFKEKEAIFKHVQLHEDKIHHFQINKDKNQHSNINKTGATTSLESKCGICGLEAKSRKDLREHLFKVHNNKRVKCDQCERPFRDSYALRRHKIVKHSTEKNVKCDVCNKVFKLHDNMILHKRRFHERRFECEICGVKQPTAYTLKKHVEMVHEKKNVMVCDVCGEGFVYAHRFRIHKRRHEGEFPFKCSYCDKRYTSKESLSHHENTHTREREYICDLCGNKYLQYGHLARHKQLHDKSSQPIKCKFCDAGFRAYSAYRSHVFKEHLEEALATGSKMILKCEYCPKLFAHPTHLQAHVNRHTGEKPYKCEICGKSFNDKSNLRQHKYSHDDKEVYRCSYCPKVYTQRRGYRTHLKTHEGIEGEEGSGDKVYKLKGIDNCVGGLDKTNKMKGTKGMKGGRAKINKASVTTVVGETGINVEYEGNDIQNIMIGDKAFTVVKAMGQNDKSVYTVLNSESPNQIRLTGNSISSLTNCDSQSLKTYYNDMPTLDRLPDSTDNENMVSEKHAAVPYLNTSSSCNTHPYDQSVGNIPTVVSYASQTFEPNYFNIDNRQGFVETPTKDIVNVKTPVQEILETPAQGTANATRGVVKTILQSNVNTLVTTSLQGSMNTSLPETVDALMHIEGDKPIQSTGAIPKEVSLDTSIPSDNTEIYIVSLAEKTNGTQSQGNSRLVRDALDASEYQVQLPRNDVSMEQNYVLVPQSDKTSTVLVLQDKAT